MDELFNRFIILCCFIKGILLDSEVISSELGIVDVEVNASIDKCGILDLQDVNEHINTDKQINKFKQGAVKRKPESPVEFQTWPQGEKSHE